MNSKLVLCLGCLTLAGGLVGACGDDPVVSGDGGADSDSDSDADSDSDSDTDSDADADTDSDADTDTDADCVVLTSGSWVGSGNAFPMDMQVDLVMDATACSFTLEWAMDHGANAEGGTIVGDQVTLTSEATDYYASCVGTADSVTHVSGTCSDDGASFGFEAE